MQFIGAQIRHLTVKYGRPSRPEELGTTGTGTHQLTIQVQKEVNVCISVVPRVSSHTMAASWHLALVNMATADAFYIWAHNLRSKIEIANENRQPCWGFLESRKMAFVLFCW